MSEFWSNHGDFWVNVGLALGGILTGIIAAVQAGKAKDAAKEASKKVHKQDIIIILTEILNECDLNQSIEYPEASSKHTFIHKKICNIKGLYNKYLNAEQITYLGSIEANLVSIRTAVDTFNNALNIGNNVTNTPANDLIYLTLVSPFSTLSGNLELLKGSLQTTLFE